MMVPGRYSRQCVSRIGRNSGADGDRELDSITAALAKSPDDEDLRPYLQNLRIRATPRVNETAYF
jgi:hypothetical protein